VFCDLGDDISAYLGDRFFRSWVANGGAGSSPRQQGTFRWRTSGGWESAEPGDPALARQLAQYQRSRKASRLNGEILTAEEMERLRALGYAPPRAEAP